MQTVTSIVKAPMTENASDVAKGAVYILTAFVVFMLKLVGHIIRYALKAIAFVLKYTAIGLTKLVKRIEKK